MTSILCRCQSNIGVFTEEVIIDTGLAYYRVVKGHHEQGFGFNRGDIMDAGGTVIVVISILKPKQLRSEHFINIFESGFTKAPRSKLLPQVHFALLFNLLFKGILVHEHQLAEFRPKNSII